MYTDTYFQEVTQTLSHLDREKLWKKEEKIKATLLITNILHMILYIRCGIPFINNWKTIASILSNASMMTVFSSATDLNCAINLTRIKHSLPMAYTGLIIIIIKLLWGEIYMRLQIRPFHDMHLIVHSYEDFANVMEAFFCCKI